MPMFYRLVETDSPTLDDFLSYVELGIEVRDDPEARERAEGVSVNATLAQARNRARTVPALAGHRFVAALEVPEGGAIRYRRTGLQRGHHTLWGDPDALLACVVSVATVDAVDYDPRRWR